MLNAEGLVTVFDYSRLTAKYQQVVSNEVFRTPFYYPLLLCSPRRA